LKGRGCRKARHQAAGGGHKDVAAEWKKLATRFSNTDIDFSGELDDIQESFDAMGVLFLPALCAAWFGVREAGADSGVEA
jgi:hypothetical protein